MAAVAEQGHADTPPDTPLTPDPVSVTMPMLEFTLQPGEMYFINNYTILHARTAFEDFEEEDRRRHLLRLWLEVPHMRPVHPHIQSRGIEAVPGRTPSYDWSKLTKNRN